jgi:hypothetical protein
VGDQNGTILSKILKPVPEQDAQTKEISRRQSIETLLRNEYVLTHRNISAAMLAGTEQPPADWMNEKLKQLGETWKVENNREPLSEPPQSTTIQTQAPYGNLAARCDELGSEIISVAEQRKKLRPDTVTNRVEYNEWYMQNDGFIFHARYYSLVAKLHRDLTANNLVDPKLDALISEHEKYFEQRQRNVQEAIAFPQAYHLSIDEIEEIGLRLKRLGTQVPSR